MVFKTEIADVNAFKEMMKALLVVNKEATITFEEWGLTCEVMDTSHVMEILWRLDKSMLNHYEFGVGDTKATFDLEQLMKFIDGFGKDDSLSLELNEETNKLQIKGRVSTEGKGGKAGRLKSFSIPLLDLVEDEVPQPKIFFKSKVRMLTQDLVEALKDAYLVDPTFTILIEDTGITVSAAGDMGSATNIWEKGADALIDLKIEESSKTSFILDKVQPVVAQGRRCSDVVTIELTTDMPMKLDFETDKGKLEYYIAPTIGG
jgi:proliferating cell nuclear antigen